MCSSSVLLDRFTEANRLLAQCAKALSSFLDSRRLAFPRFYFLSNDELVTILSQSTDPLAVQPHLSKCFEGIAQLVFERLLADGTSSRLVGGSGFGIQLKIVGMTSPQGEFVPFRRAIDPDSHGGRAHAELWLRAVEDAMKDAIDSSIGHAMVDYVRPPGFIEPSRKRISTARPDSSSPARRRGGATDRYLRLELDAAVGDGGSGQGHGFGDSAGVSRTQQRQDPLDGNQCRPRSAAGGSTDAIDAANDNDSGIGADVGDNDNGGGRDMKDGNGDGTRRAVVLRAFDSAPTRAHWVTKWPAQVRSATTPLIFQRRQPPSLTPAHRHRFRNR